MRDRYSKADKAKQHASHAAGYNVCIFAYGQTGSGKTHTMAGTNIEQYEGRGINYRALDDLFALNAKRQGEVILLHTACMTEAPMSITSQPDCIS